MNKLAILGAACAIVVVGLLNIGSAFRDPVTWTPDALYYQANLLEIRGDSESEAIAKTFRGPISAELRSLDPEHTANPAWVRYNEPFYERRIAVPLAGAALYELDGDRSLLDISLAGYIAALLALFLLLLLRFRLAVATGVTLAASFLPPLVNHSSFPLTDSWGLALMTLAFAAAILTLDRGRRWLLLWIAALLVLSFTRDSTWIPVLAVGWCAFRLRSRESVWLFGTGLASALPVVLFLGAPVKNLLAQLVNDNNVPADASWSFILSSYPGALVDLVRANGGFLRDGEWYAGLLLVGGVVLLLALALRGHYRRDSATMLMTAGAVVSVFYVLAAPAFSAFRLELAFLPMAAYGLALGSTLLLERVARPTGTPAPERVASRSPLQ
jgi:hypothetical protein